MKKNGIRWLVLSVLAALVAGVYFYMTEKPEFPKSIYGVTPSDYVKLKKAVFTGRIGKAQAAIARSTISNSLYVSSNLRDGSKLTLEIGEVPGTVIEPARDLHRPPVSVPLHQHLALTGSFPFSPGEYHVLVKSGSSVLDEETVFLGDAENYPKKLIQANQHREELARDASKQFEKLRDQIELAQKLAQELTELATENKRGSQKQALKIASELNEPLKELVNSSFLSAEKRPIAHKILFDLNEIRGESLAAIKARPRPFPIENLRSKMARLRNDILAMEKTS